MEHVLCSHIRGHLDAHEILSDTNHGFRARHNTETQLLTQLLLTTYDLLYQRDQRHSVNIAILDFSKAFDTMPHGRLLGNLEHYGITGDILRWNEGFLLGRKQAVLVDGVKSAEKDVISGVPQGTVLRPLLFLLHINDMPSVLDTSTSCRLFADDCLVYQVVNSIQDQIQLQRDLKRLEEWAHDWGMVFNPSKCHIMAVGSGPRTISHIPHFYELCGSILTSVDQEKYLGVMLSHDLTWSPHIEKVATKANQKLDFIRRNLKGSPEKLKKLAYIALVRSGLEYASVIWDPHLAKDRDRLERCQRHTARWIKSSYSHTASVSQMLKDLELKTLQERKICARLVFMYKILNSHVAVPPPSLNIEKNTRPTRGLATKDRLIVPRCNKTDLQESFAPKTILDWNKLPQSVTAAGSVASFKSQISQLKP